MEHWSETSPEQLQPHAGLAAEDFAIPLPAEPMAPVSAEELPAGDDWGYQLKWDGVRILARLNGHGHVELFSRKLYLKNGTYPEIKGLLESKAAALGSCLLDGEIVWWDGVRPSFQHVLKRERSRGLRQPLPPQADQPQTVRPAPVQAMPAEAGSVPPDPAGVQNVELLDSSSVPAQPSSVSHALAKPGGALVYVLFDLLADETGDLRQLPYKERHLRLTAKCAAISGDPRLLVTDLFQDGEALWDWVERSGWEGVVSKRLSSPYREGKKHRDWLKKKTAIMLDVDIVGLKWRGGIIASLVMEYEGDYLGSVSLGLNEALRKVLAATFRPQHSHLAVVACPFAAVPEDLKRENVQWLSMPFRCRVTGLERTSAGQLRHPKLVTFLPKEGLS
ncbi:DNA ligase [Paenibacillus sp. R14(2021)]|uniref:ATP-dependent DNA ligase n=1 Tax=Paenibacillus sp. R14(2021) TaxID=2859228 RepID=UPI001C611347|nr:DNA ligase [Paenibacillus sp. R14(2021)]